MTQNSHPQNSFTRLISKNLFKMVILFLGTAVISFIVAKIALGGAKIVAETFFPPAEPTADQDTTPEFIDLQPTLDAWIEQLSGNASIMIYDLDNDKIAAEYQSGETFYAASVYKLLFAYDGYQQIDAKLASADEKFITTYDYRADSYTLGECLDLIVRESYNGCAEPMRSDKKRFTRIENFTKQLGLANTSAAGLYSSAADLITLLKYYYKHPELSEESWQKLRASMLDQPATKVDKNEIEDWRQGLPNGFTAAEVYDKVGWLYGKKGWETYNDLAFVEFPEQNRHFAIAVLTKNVASAQTISELGQEIEEAVLNFTPSPQNP